MAEHAIERRLIGGVWQTVDVEEDSGGGGAFNGGTITGALHVEPDGAVSVSAVTVDTSASGSSVAIDTVGRTRLHHDSAPFTVHRTADFTDNAVLKITGDGKLSVTPDINTAGASVPALAVDAAAAVTNLFRLRTGANDVCTVDKLGAVQLNKPGGNYYAYLAPGRIQLVALDSGADIELCKSDGNLVVQVTDDGRLGFYNHAAVAQQTGVAVDLAAVHAALVNLGLITA